MWFHLLATHAILALPLAMWRPRGRTKDRFHCFGIYGQIYLGRTGADGQRTDGQTDRSWRTYLLAPTTTV